MQRFCRFFAVFGVSLFWLGIAGATAGVGVTYHGRLVGPDGTPVTSSGVQFRLQIRTPGSENCLMYEEIQSKDMSASGGVFAITINDGSGARQDSNSVSLDQLFANRGSFSFPAGYCVSGSAYSPNASDGRSLQVYFNDGSFSGWEPVPSQAINFVPMAIEAMQVGGYKKEQLLKIADGVPTASTELSNASWTELLALIGGSSAQYIKPGSASFTAAPQWAGTPSGANDLANKAYVDAQVAAGLPNFGTAGTYTKVTTDAKGRVSSGTTLAATDIPVLDASKITTGVIGVANGGTGQTTATAAFNALAPTQTGNSGKFLTTDGTNASWSVLSSSQWTTSGSDIYYSTGNVGVGTATPASKLQVSGTTVLGATGGGTSYFNPGYTNTLLLNGAAQAATVAAGVQFGDGFGAASRQWGIYNGRNTSGQLDGALNFVVSSTNNADALGGSTVMTFLSNHNVGIGTVAPTAPLEVKASSGGSDVFRVTNASGVPVFNFYSSMGGHGQLLIKDASPTTRFSLDSTSGAISVIDTSSVTQVYLNSQGSSHYFKTGNVGIGTTSPGEMLDVDGGNSVKGIVRIVNSATTYGPTLKLKSSGTGGHEYWLSSTQSLDGTGAGAFQIYDNTTFASRFVIGANGSVGIGTASPQATLDVNGYAKLKLNSSAPIACSASYSGSVAMNSTSIPCVCNGTAWYYLDSLRSGPVACAW